MTLRQLVKALSCLILFAMGCSGPTPSATGAGAAASENIGEIAQANSIITPVSLTLNRLTLGYHVCVSSPVYVTVTLPGASAKQIFIGNYYAPNEPISNSNTDFSCQTLSQPVSNGGCSTALPIYTTPQPVSFTGQIPAGAGSGVATVTLNLGDLNCQSPYSYSANFTITDKGVPSQTCIAPSSDTGGWGLCWQVAPTTLVTMPPLLQTVLYRAPGESSAVSYEQDDSTTVATTWAFQSQGTVGVSYMGSGESGGVTFQGQETATIGRSTTTGTMDSWSIQSTQILPDPYYNEYFFILQASAILTQGQSPGLQVDLASGVLYSLTLRQLVGLAQNPQDVSTIQAGDQTYIKNIFTPDRAGQFIQQDPFYTGQDITQNTTRFQQVFPPTPLYLQKRDCQDPRCGDHVDQFTHIMGQSQSMGVERQSGVQFSFTVTGDDVTGSLGATETFINSTTVTNTQQASASLTLHTSSYCVEGPIDVYLDTAFGSFVTLPHLWDSCNGPTVAGVLLPGQTLVPGQSLTSNNGAWSLQLQADGTLVQIYTADGSQGSFVASGVAFARMESYGSFVAYDGGNNVIFSTGTSSTAGAYLIMQDDGTLVVYNPNPQFTGGLIPPLWQMYPGG
jgi:hypothetical protein